MPYVPGKTPMLCNMGEATFVFKIGGKSVSIKPNACLNLDAIALRDSAYINSRLGGYERAGTILFSSSGIAAKRCKRESHDESAFSNNLDALIKIEDSKEHKGQSRKHNRRERAEKRAGERSEEKIDDGHDVY